jgi:hypothetical protein
MQARVVFVVVALATVSACRTVSPPQIKFAPPGTDTPRLRTEFPLSDVERAALTPENIRALTQEQVDQIYKRLSAGRMPDGPFRGDLFFPRDQDGNARLGDLIQGEQGVLAHLASLRIESLGRAFWRGKVFFRKEGILRNRIEELSVLKPLIDDADSIPRLTFDGQTTWLLFPARLSCGDSRLDTTRRSVVIDYAEGPKIEGYRDVPDKLAGPEGLSIRDEVRIVRPGFYLGRAYFRGRFGLNFTLLDPAGASAPPTPATVQEDCAP